LQTGAGKTFRVKVAGMARRKQNRIHGIDCDYYAVMYAEILIRDRHFRADDLPHMLNNEKYKALSQRQKQDVVSGIRYAAKELFFKEGYERELVERIFRENQ
jgi:hypothetical protein